MIFNPTTPEQEGVKYKEIEITITRVSYNSAGFFINVGEKINTIVAFSGYAFGNPMLGFGYPFQSGYAGGNIAKILCVNKSGTIVTGSVTVIGNTIDASWTSPGSSSETFGSGAIGVYYV